MILFVFSPCTASSYSSSLRHRTEDKHWCDSQVSSFWRNASRNHRGNSTTSKQTHARPNTGSNFMARMCNVAVNVKVLPAQFKLKFNQPFLNYSFRGRELTWSDATQRVLWSQEVMWESSRNVNVNTNRIRVYTNARSRPCLHQWNSLPKGNCCKTSRKETKTETRWREVEKISR